MRYLKISKRLKIIRIINDSRDEEGNGGGTQRLDSRIRWTHNHVENILACT